MNQRKRTIGFGEIAAAISFGAMILATVPVCSAFAQKPAAKAASVGEEASPKQIQELMTLLGDPKVRNWLEKESKAQAAAEQAATEESVSQALDGRLAAIREHLAALAGTVPDLPNQFWQGRERVTADLGENGRTKALLLLAFFVGLGAAVEWLFRKATQRARGRLDSLPLETASDRLRVVALRFAFAVGLVAAFALGSIGPFLARDWPPLLRQMLFGLLVAFLVVRIANVVSHFLLAPDHERFRIVPMDTVVARFWHRRLVWFVGWFAFGWVLVGFWVAVGYTVEARQRHCHGNCTEHALRAKARRESYCCDRISPLCRRFGSKRPQGGSGDEVALEIEGVVNHTVHTE